MIGQIHHVQTWDDGQSLGKMVTVGEIQVEHIANLGVLWKAQEESG